MRPRRRLTMINSAFAGHHRIYSLTIADYLTKSCEWDVDVIAPNQGNNHEIQAFPPKKDFFSYYSARERWLKSLVNRIECFNPSIIHIMTADSIYSLGKKAINIINCNKSKIIATVHHIPLGFIRGLVFNNFTDLVDKIVVHSEFCLDYQNMIAVGHRKVNVIEYPAFHNTGFSSEEARRKIGLPQNKKIFLLSGVIGPGKGLELLVQAMEKVERDFLLCICGRLVGYTQTEIISKIENIKNKVFLEIKELSDEEFGLFIDACDCVVAPYRKNFTGASGPITEGIWRGKMVITPSDGVLGPTVNKYKLGLTFSPEDANELKEKIQYYIDSIGVHRGSKESEEYRHRLSTDMFLKKYSALYEATILNKN